MNKSILMATALTALLAGSTACTHTAQVNGPYGPEYTSTEGPLGGSTVINGGPTYQECMKFAGMDPRLMPFDKFAACRGMMPGAGGGMMPGAGVMISPAQSGVYGSPGSAAFVAGPTPGVEAPNAGTTATSGGGYATKDDVKAIGKTVVKHDSEICKLKKSTGCK